jgi:hypothetical protein
MLKPYESPAVGYDYILKGTQVVARKKKTGTENDDFSGKLGQGGGMSIIV